MAKRVKVTGTGKVKRRRSFKGHLLSSRPRKRLRRLNQSTVVTGADAGKILEALGKG